MTGATVAAFAVAGLLSAGIIAGYAIPAYRHRRAVDHLAGQLRDAGFSDDTVVDLLGLLRAAVTSDDGRAVLRGVLRRCGYRVPDCLHDRSPR